jgi:hypothetical protein
MFIGQGGIPFGVVPHFMTDATGFPESFKGGSSQETDH